MMISTSSTAVYICFCKLLRQHFKVTPLELWNWRQWLVPNLGPLCPYMLYFARISEISISYWTVKIDQAWLTFALVHLTLGWHSADLSWNDHLWLPPLAGTSPIALPRIFSFSRMLAFALRDCQVLCNLVKLVPRSGHRHIFKLSQVGIQLFTSRF